MEQLPPQPTPMPNAWTQNVVNGYIQQKNYARKQQLEQELSGLDAPWHSKVLQFTVFSVWGIAILVFLGVLLTLVLMKPGFVCNRARTVYEEDKLSVIRVLLVSAAAGIAAMIIGFFVSSGQGGSKPTEEE